MASALCMQVRSIPRRTRATTSTHQSTTLMHSILQSSVLWRRRVQPSARSTPRLASLLTTTVPNAKQPLRVCVVGGGAVGLTSALRLLQLNHRPDLADNPAKPNGVTQPRRPVEVTVLASSFGADTTTAGAAGLWGPYKLSDTPEHLINRWGAATYSHLLQLAHSGLADAAGVSMVSTNSLFPEPQELPFWRHIPLNFALMDERTLAGLSQRARSGSERLQSAILPGSDCVVPNPDPDPDPFRCGWGYHWQSIVCEGSRYLPWLTEQIRGLGGRLRRVSPLTSLEQLSCPEVDLRDGDVDLVVNAAGLGSLELLPDPEVVPIRGQVVRVEAPWVKQAYFYEPYYIIPNRDTVVLGGTGQKGDFNLTVSAEDKRRILDGCCRLLPSLRRARVVADWVGLRPGRTSLRLELQREGVRQGAGSSGSPGGGGRVVPVVHNYGHGGAGLTLAWGCAGDVVRLIVEEGLME